MQLTKGDKSFSKIEQTFMKTHESSSKTDETFTKSGSISIHLTINYVEKNNPKPSQFDITLMQIKK